MENVLEGLDLMTRIQIKNHADQAVARINEGDAKFTGYIINNYGRIIIFTAPRFDTEAEAVAHMQEVIDACKALETA